MPLNVNRMKLQYGLETVPWEWGNELERDSKTTQLH